jgi:hypothetical protein
MMGLFVGAWFGLPIEAVVLWLAVTFTTVMVYETYKILICIRRLCHVSWKTAIFRAGLLGLGQTRAQAHDASLRRRRFPNGRSPNMLRGYPAIAREHSSPDITVPSTQGRR